MKKGFTVIELVVSFVLISIISLVMFNLIVSLKQLYINANIKTSLLNKQGIITKKIYNDLNGRQLKKIRSCGVSCVTFIYEENDNGEVKNIPIQLLVDVAANTIRYDDYVMELTDGSKTIYDVDNHILINYVDSVLYVNVPIKTEFMDEDFGVHIVKKINDCDVDTTIKFDDATIVANNVIMPLTKLKFEDEDFNRNFSFEPEYTKTNRYAIFAKIFHQSRLDGNGNIVDYNSFDDFLKNNNEYKRSTLKSIESFRSFDKKEDLINEIIANSDSSLDEKELKTSFKNGYLELLLNYPHSGSMNLNNYNWWVQTSNFTVDSSLENFVNFDTAHSGSGQNKWISGLKMIDNNKCYVSGTGNGNYFTLGTKNQNELMGADSKEDNVDLWIRAEEYIKRYGLSVFDESTNTIVLTFDGNGGSVFQKQIGIDAGMKITLPVPTRKNKIFLGWFTEKDGGKMVSNDTVWTNSTKLYAHWG